MVETYLKSDRQVVNHHMAEELKLELANKKHTASNSTSG